jgi:hypothetical protein
MQTKQRILIDKFFNRIKHLGEGVSIALIKELANPKSELSKAIKAYAKHVTDCPIQVGQAVKYQGQTYLVQALRDDNYVGNPIVFWYQADLINNKGEVSRVNISDIETGKVA